MSRRVPKKMSAIEMPLHDLGDLRPDLRLDREAIRLLDPTPVFADIALIDGPVAPEPTTVRSADISR